MCEPKPNELDAIVHQAVMGTGATVLSSTPPVSNGSRRRRLWELDDHAHCPVMGVCMPMAALRRLVDKTLGGQAVADDYDLHCGVVADCKLRTKLAEALQRELDRRYALALRQAAKLKTTEALVAWWAQQSQEDLAGALWATLSHARCTPALTHHVLGRVHMIQHQVGAAQRADLQRFEALIDENAVLTRALGQAQGRHTSLSEEMARRTEAQQGEMLRLRAELMGRDTTIANLKEALQTLEAAAPGLKSRYELARQGERQIERIHQLERALLQSQQDAERQRRQAQAWRERAREQDAAPDEAVPAPMPSPPAPGRLDDRAVLCVGGRQASVPVYRQLIEHAGGRFLHHDGGEEENTARLDATLAAADLVICQTGCISHDAYWRVKNHCKRSGKPCVFIENPSMSSLARGLAALSLSPDTSVPVDAAAADEVVAFRP